MAGYTGYLTGFNTGTAYTLIDHSTQLGLNVISTAVASQPRVEMLPNGTKVNYDGTSGAPRIPGKLTQRIRLSSGASTAMAKWAILEGAIGKQGTLTLTTLGAAAKTCTAVLESMTETSQRPISDRAAMIIDMTFDCLTEFA